MIKDEENPISHIYKHEGINISLNKITDGLIKFIEDEKIEVEHIESMRRIYDKYQFEEEHFANFNLNEIELIEKFEIV